MLRSSFLHLQPVTPVKIIRRKQFLRAKEYQNFSIIGEASIYPHQIPIFPVSRFYNRITIGKLELSTLHVIILGDT